MLCFEYVDFKGNGCENEVEIPYGLLNTLADLRKEETGERLLISVTAVHEIVDKEKKCKESERRG